MKSFKKLLAILLAVIMVFSTFSMCITVNAANVSTSDTEPIKIEVTTDKSSYTAIGTAKISVKVTNIGDTALENVSAESLCENLAPINKGSQLTAETDKLNKGESLSFSFDTTVKTSFNGLSFFQKFGLFFKRLFKTKIAVKDNGFDNGREVETYTSTIKFGKFDVPNTVKVWYGKAIISDKNWFQDVDESHIAKGTDIEYIDNHLIILFFPRATQQQKESVIKSINGKIIGKDNLDGKYQVEISKTKDIDELRTICEKVNKMPGVLGCQYESVYDVSSLESSVLKSIPNDPWKDTIQGILGTNWDEDNPDGLNWGLEAIQAQSAWDKNNRFTNIKIGVADNGFDINHEDLKINIINKKDNSSSGIEKSHGTHVAGIIGATANNNIGITGIVWNKELYCADVMATNSQKKEHISMLNGYEGLQELLKYDCKVLNYSIASKKPIKDTEEIIESGANAANFILYWSLYFNRNDFIIVQSAGNETEESLTGGSFCSITNNSIERMFNSFADDVEEECRKLYSAEDIMSHVLVVGSINKPSSKGEYKLSWFSNYGDLVSIVAPGNSIYSTIWSGGITGNYGYMSGTSMAAPMVTGVASLVWSVNPSFTAEEVKEIVCSSYNKQAKGYGSDDRTYPIVNAKLSVEEAIRRTDSNSMIAGTFYDKTTNQPIQGVNVNITSDNYSKKVVTDENGSFSARVPENRTYKCKLEKEHYQTKILIAEITQNKIFNFSPCYLSREVCNFNGDVEKYDTDFVGLMIPNVKITLTLEETGTTYVIYSDDSGHFSTNIPYGNYRITYEHEGYDPFTETRLISKKDEYIGWIYLKNSDDYNLDEYEFREHIYKVFDISYSWKNAKEYCESIGGHLVTVSSKEENDFIYSIISSKNKSFYWIGATDEHKEGDWKWVTSEKFDYSNWSSWFDNNYPGGENYAAILKVNQWGEPSQWNDFSVEGSNDSSFDFGFICEWGIDQPDDAETEEIKNSFDFLGDATVLSGGTIQLTPLEYWKCGGVWYKNQVNAKNGLKIKFSYWAGGGHDNYYGGADGIVVLFSNNTYNLGDAGGALGFVRDSALGVEFDSYCGNWGDPDGKHIAIVQNDASNHLQYVLDNRVDDEQWHDVEIQLYNNTINVVLDDKNVLSYTNLDNISDTLYIGIAASTGDGYNMQQIKNFNYESLGLGTASQSGTCGDNATWSYYESDKILVINGSGEMQDYYGGNAPWNSISDNIEEIAIGNGITTVGNTAFSGFRNLKSITLPNGLKSIGNDAFYLCQNLEYITIPDTVTSIGSYSFASCNNLREIFIPANIKSIGSSAFYRCNNLQKINVDSRNRYYHSSGNCLIDTSNKVLIQGCCNSVIPSDGSVTVIGESAFNNCTQLKNITIPNTIKEIKTSAFFNCSSLNNVVIPNSVTIVGSSAFLGVNSSNKSIILPKGLTNIGDKAFGYVFEYFTYTKITDFKIYCYENTPGQSYAINNNFQYALL